MLKIYIKRSSLSNQVTFSNNELELNIFCRALDYMEIVNSERRGLWNVPYISSCYLISSKILKGQTADLYLHDSLDPDMALTANLRAMNVFMYVSNRVNFGHLINNEKFATNHLHNELWEMKTNRYKLIF